MTGANHGTEFEYSADQIREIEKHLPLNRFQRILCIDFSIRPAVRTYLSALKESEMLPEKEYLAKRRSEKMEQVEAVLKMIRQPDDLTDRFKQANEELMAKGEPLLDELGILVSGFEHMSSVDFENAIACRVLMRIQQNLELESYEEHIKAENKRDPKHRNELIGRLVDIWSNAMETPVSNCEISKEPSSPLLRFIQAVCDPLWAAIGPVADVTKQRIGPEMIFKIVCNYRDAARVGNELAPDL
ncbi:hypothetical protein [Rhizobium laguerreae]|uniref:hypothetical protein n=1 Tax=Rhizobium laguerreae TaxID=1076926 RepID=UPI001C90998D|nr:hypothetical protein [Rhizobium laguerreae]MBY3447460.1 hypothetical protein [Rhizobium laguerreae]